MTSIVYYFGNGIGTSTLLSQVLSCQKDNLAIEKVISYIFSLFNMNEKIQDSPHDLKMLLTLLTDEKKKIQNFIQVNVIKALVSSPAILNYYTKDGVIDFSKYYEENTSFHSAVILLLANCCINNEFAIKQCQKFLPLQVVIKELLNPSLNLRVKKAYFHYLNYAFMNSFLENTNYSLLETLFKRVVIPDLCKFKNFLEYLPNLALQEAYKTVNYKKEIRIEGSDQGYIVREYLNTDEIYVKSNTELSTDEKEALGY